ncbi:hypothetical protein [Rhodococcus sp. (in: high G+C Gram-positive bacteria)]|uniref:hypothetical protein n=1 Tax=unclassified Rhodococcus (in: high G+C Gram-positive bacteria) TaxID=192944 RepID=UPI00197E76D6|nr:hypothetical protein [Rhodococcus sp. (in: high G+C Gram-positive bacteria)]
MLCAGPATATPSVSGPLAPANPYLGPVGTSTMHGDAGSSDVTPLPGPGTGPHEVTAFPMMAACPTVLQGSDGMVVSLCTTMIGQIPTIHLIDPKADATPLGRSVAQLPLAKGSLLGGVYAYLDNENRLVAVDGNRQLVRISHAQNPDGSWRLELADVIDLSGAVASDDNVTGLAPDWEGNVWFATGHGTVGYVGTDRIAHSIALPEGEQVQNSISTSPTGTAVATTHALYQLKRSGDEVVIDWRQPYDRGPARNPGQLSWGTGSTPTYFGPSTGSDFLTIVDNAHPTVSLHVYRADTGAEVCTQPVLSAASQDGSPSGSENSPVGIGHSVYVAGTYGYPYPTTPEGAGPAVPATAPFNGGMTRVDIDPVGCHVVWDNTIRSSAVPHLSTADGSIYTVTRDGAANTSPLDGYSFAVIDSKDGSQIGSTPLPSTILNDTLQMSALITESGEYFQGTISGIVRVRAN